MYIHVQRSSVAQVNLHTTPAFEAALAKLMELRGLRTRSEAIRVAVEEAAERAEHACRRADFASWLGASLVGPENPEPRFHSDDDLWNGP